MTRQFNIKKLTTYLTVAATGFSMMGCASSSKGDVAVQSVAALCGYSTIGAANRFAGMVSPRKQVGVKKSNDLTVAEILVEEGQEVEEGQILFTYDGEEAENNLRKAQLELEQLNNGIETKESEIEALEKDKKKAPGDQQLTYTLEIQNLQIELQEAVYNVGIKESEIDKLTRQTENLEVTAPVSGKVKSIGDQNNGSDQDSASDAFITITETGNLQIKGFINENNLSSLMEGTPVLVRSRLDEEMTWTGLIESIDWESPVNSSSDSMYYGEDASAEMTSSSKYPFYIELDSTDGLMLGQHVYIEPDMEEDGDMEDALQIFLSSAFINDAEGSAWVWTENGDGKLEKRSVTLGFYDEYGDTYEITDGLTLEDYVAFAVGDLSEGMNCVEYTASYEESLEEEVME